MKGQDDNLKINPALRLLVFPLTEAEYAALEEEILTIGNRKPVQCWYGYIISDFERVEICQRHGIPFEVSKTNFCSEIEIIAKICQRELAEERLLSSDMRRYLIGKLYNAEKVIAAHRAAGTDRYKEKARREPSREKIPTDVRLANIQERLGRRYRLNPATIARYAVYAKGIDNIFFDDPQKAERILRGDLKMSIDIVRSYALSGTGTVSVCSENDIQTGAAQHTYEPLPVGPSVKDMPEFDPDAEVNSLSLTIPSWVQSLRRIHLNEKFALITDEGRQHLSEELRRLISAANKLDSALGVK